MKKDRNLRDWVIQHITNNPNITFGSLYRDACFSKFKVDELSSVLKILKEEDKIIKVSTNFNSYYNLSKQLQRNKILNKLGL